MTHLMKKMSLPIKCGHLSLALLLDPIKSRKKHLLKSGKSSYRQPVANPNPLSQKLVPPPLPRQTKHD
jgi:hypothetical protein